MGQFGLQIAIWLILANMRVSLNVQIFKVQCLGRQSYNRWEWIAAIALCGSARVSPHWAEIRGEHPLSTEGLGGPRMRDPYEILGVAKGASAAEIKSAFRKRAKTLHPDANRHDPKAATRFSELNAAYE